MKTWFVPPIVVPAFFVLMVVVYAAFRSLS